MDYYKLDSDNHPVETDMTGYYEWYRTLPEETRTGIGFTVALTERDGVTVSTVFLGMDHAYHGPPPVLWETMIFGGERDMECQRYSSQSSAVAGHARTCKEIWPA